LAQDSLEILRLILYHVAFRFQGKPVFLFNRPALRSGFRKLGATVILAVATGIGSTVQAKGLVADDTVALSALPVEAQATHRLVLAGGPFPHGKDGVAFGNRERLLPSKTRGYYREYTVPTPGARNRGARRLVCGGVPPTKPAACYYTDDHYASFRRVQS
jgi:ribonuclease T1